MSDVDDLVSGFGGDSDSEKVEAFDESTTTLILQQMGIPTQRIKQLRWDNGEAYGLSWLTEEMSLEIDLWAARCFEFNLGHLLTAPAKSPILKAYQEHVDGYETNHDRFMVFKAYGVGRLVAMSRKPQGRAYVCALSGDVPVYVTTFKNLFSDLFGSENEL